MKTLRSLFKQYITDKPMIFIGLKFCIWYGLVHVLVSNVLIYFPNVLQSYLELASQFSVLVLNSGFGLPYEMHGLKEGVGIWNGDFLSVIVNETCGGVPIYKLYVVLILAFVAGSFKKILGILLGVPALLFANMVRIIGILLVKEFYPIYYNFAHEIVFVYLMYGLAIWLWYKFYQTRVNKD